MVEQAVEISRLPHILIATPGRLADHLQSGTEIPLEKMRILCLDEADRLLDGQFDLQMKKIFAAVPSKRQTFLFSATISDALARLQKISMKKKNSFFFEEKNPILTVDLLDQRFVLCPVDVKDAFLVFVVKNFHQKHPNSSILIFAQTCRECQALTGMFKDLGEF